MSSFPKKLKIAMVSTPWLAVPPKGYGGIEWVVYHLTEELVRRGHDVTLFTVDGSKSSAKVRTLFKKEQRDVLNDMGVNILNVALAHSVWAYQEISKGDFDLVHDHTWKEGLASAIYLPLPVVHTLHGPMNKFNRDFYRVANRAKNVSFVTISDFQRTGAPGLHYIDTVYNAIDVDTYKHTGRKQNYFLYLGRINADKGTHIACRVAKQLKVPLKIAGKLNEPGEIAYFKKYVKPYLSKDIEYLGEVSDAKKKQLFAGAKAFLFPLRWNEPFGLVMAEAMASGTPVVTFRMGSAAEIVTNGVTGYVVDTYPQFLKAAHATLESPFDPEVLREDVRRRFSVQVMTEGYEKVYLRALPAFRR